MADEIDFTFNGQTRRLSRDQVISAMRGQTPGLIQTYAVVIEGRQFPVKQVLASAMQVPRSDFISTRARDLLGRLDFDVVNLEEGSSSQRGGRSLREAALMASVRFHAGGTTGVDQVLEDAMRFTTWLDGDESAPARGPEGRADEREAGDGAVRERLLEVARARELIYYSDLAEALGIETDNPYFAAPIGKILGRISKDEVAAGRPMLSAVVVSKDTKLPGKGFFSLGQALEQTRPGEEEVTFATRQVKLVHEYWSRPNVSRK